MSVAGALAPALHAASQAPRRINSDLNDSEIFALKGNTHPTVASGLAQDQGPVSGSQTLRMAVHFKLTPAQQADLTQLLAEQQNRRSPQFHKFLTPEQYADRFGMNSVDIEKVTAWLENSGFSNVQVARSRSWVSFNGTAAQAQNAFHTSIHNYTVNGEAHFANATDPQLPKALDGIADGVRGLHNFLPKPHIRSPKPHFTSSISGYTYLAPADWNVIYDVNPLYNNLNLDGSPIKSETYSIVVVGQSDVNASDLANFRAAAGLPAKTITTMIPPGDKDPGLQRTSGDESESDLDLEWANAIAKNGNILFVTADSNPDGGVEDSIAWAIDNNYAPILSTSYGLCEAQVEPADFNTEQALFAQANTQGMTIVAAAGDDGAADCDSGTNETIATLGLAVDYPASSQYVTGVGGTTLQAEGAGQYFSATDGAPNGTESALSYIPEAVWNDGPLGTNLATNFQNATGGGVSTLVQKPSWQTGTGVPSGNFRDVPDIAFTASPDTDGLLYCTPSGTTVTTCINSTFRNSDTTLNVTGGTSVGSPTTAGILAMLVQQTGARLGNVNPNIYSLAAISETVYHDVTTGNNNVPCKGGTPNCPSLTATVNGQYGYSAGVGYDQVTGWGSLDANNFVEQWSADIQLSASPATLSIPAGSSGTATITVTPYKNFTGTVSFSCSVASTLVGVTCSVPSTTVTTSGSTTVTITAASNAVAPLRMRLIRDMPPPRPEWLLFALLLAVAMDLLRKPRWLYTRPLHASGAAALLLTSLFVVSCGGGSSGGSGSGITPLSLSCTLPATAQVGVAYSGSCSASNGTAPYTYSITSGALPAGLTLNTSTGAITGTPTTQGANSSFTVTATDSESPAVTASQAETLKVAETGNVTVTATSGGIVNTTTIAVTVSGT